MATPSCRSARRQASQQSTAGRWQRRLVIMVKAPLAGRVKTRLSRDIGVVGATAFYRRATAALVQRLAGDRRWQTVLAISPDSALPAPFWPHELQRVAQGPGDLGARMQRLFDRLPPGPVVIIGSDCVSVGRSDIADAFAALGAADAVLGPAEDGGYWLIGARRMPRLPRLFSGVRWSSATTLADTQANLAGRRVAMLCLLSDVDTGADLARMGGDATRPLGRTSVRGPA